MSILPWIDHCRRDGWWPWMRYLSTRFSIARQSFHVSTYLLWSMSTAVAECQQHVSHMSTSQPTFLRSSEEPPGTSRTSSPSSGTSSTDDHWTDRRMEIHSTKTTEIARLFWPTGNQIKWSSAFDEECWRLTCLKCLMSHTACELTVLTCD